MYQGKTLNELANEITRQSQTKRDMVASTELMKLSEDGETLTLEDQGEYKLNDLSHRQIGTRLKIPAKYYDRLRAGYPDLLADNVNTLFQAEPEKRMVRTLDGRARAFLSNRYHRIDNDLVLAKAVETLQESGLALQVASAEVTERRLYLKVTFPEIEREITTSRQVGDVVRSGVIVGNSEVGLGSYTVAPFLERLVCLNGMVLNDYGNRRAHVGRATGGEEDAVYELYQDDTLKADDEALLLKMRDIIRAAMSPDKFREICQRMEAAAQDGIEGNPVKAVEVLSNRIGLNEQESSKVLTNLIQGADLSRWGLLNAVTAMSQDTDIITSYDRATELESDGGRILTLNQDQWSEIAQAA